MSEEKQGKKEKRVPTLTDLEKEIRRLNRKLRDERDRTRSVEKRLRRLTAEVAEIRHDLGIEEVSYESKRSSRLISTDNFRPRSISMEEDALRRKEVEHQKHSQPSQQSSHPVQPTQSKHSEPSQQSSRLVQPTQSKALSTSNVVQQTSTKMKGWLERKQSSSIDETKLIWAKVWCSLDDRKLNIYRNEKETDLITYIPLTGAKFYGAVEKGGSPKPTMFNIQLEGNKNFLFRATTLEEKTTWENAIKPACRSGTLSPQEKRHLESISVNPLGSTK